jgi:hypothetical protein
MSIIDFTTKVDLKSIPADHEFWVAAHHGLQPLQPYPVSYALRDPYQYGNGVPEGVFTKIITGMMTGVLDEVSTVNAISAFSNHCTSDEWCSWYRMVLEKRLRLPFTVTEFNKACPTKFRITANPCLSTLAPVSQVAGLPQDFILEPYNGAQRLLVLLKGKHTHVFLEDGTPVHRMLPKVFDRFANEQGVVLEVYELSEKYYVRDILLWSQFNKEEPCPPVENRLEIIQNMLAGQNVLEVVEHIRCSATNDVREDIALILQSGYPGFVFRATGCGYWHDYANILVQPKRKSVLTCVRISEGVDKYEGRADFIWGKGRMNGKTFETPVFHGLTFVARGQILGGKDEYHGKKFDVVSCGLDPSNKLIFPIFKQWKD